MRAPRHLPHAARPRFIPALPVLIHAGFRPGITLWSLRQSITYDGLLEGTPFQRVNDRKISAMTDQVKQETGSVYVIPPARRDYLRMPDDMTNMGGGAIVPQWLAAIT